jgi:hypothetical protein
MDQFEPPKYLSSLTATINDGSKSVQARNAGVQRGRAVSRCHRVLRHRRAWTYDAGRAARRAAAGALVDTACRFLHATEAGTIQLADQQVSRLRQAAGKCQADSAATRGD